MKRGVLLLSLVLVALSAIAQESGFPDVMSDPNGVPIAESIVAILGLVAAYVVGLVRKNRKER